jgi:hypothetical protein
MVGPLSLNLIPFIHRQPRIEPIIYETVILIGNSYVDSLFIRTFDSKPASFFAKHVKHLCFGCSASLADGKRILSACTSVNDLACWMDITGRTTDLNNLPLNIPFRPKRLSVNPVLLFEGSGTPDFGSSMFQCTSHLEIMWPVRFFDFSTLDLIANLTHLAFSLWDMPRSPPITPTLNHALSSCQSLEVLVLLISKGSKSLSMRQSRQLVGFDSQDPRVVLLPCHLNFAEWKQGAQGKTDFWVFAERQVLENRAQNVSHSSHVAEQSLI